MQSPRSFAKIYTLRGPHLVEFSLIKSNTLKINLIWRRFRPSPEIREISGLKHRITPRYHDREEIASPLHP